MASSSSSTCNINNQEDGTSSFSYFKKTVNKFSLVSLRDWWLIKSDADSNFQGKRLAVAGFTCGTAQQQALRLFYSAPIIKRFDVFTLETSDGIIVILQGFINRDKTTDNGFSSQVFNHFLFGFPPYWEEFAENCFKQASPKENDICYIENFSKNLEPSSSYPTNAVNLMEDDRAVEAEPSESNKKSKKSVEMSKNKQSTSSEIITAGNDASEERAISKGADMRNLSGLSFDHTARIEANGALLGLPARFSVQPKKSGKKKNQTQGNKDGLKSTTTNFSFTSLSQDPEAVLECIFEEEVAREESLLSPTPRDFSSLEKPSNQCEIVAEVNDVTPCMTKRLSVDDMPSISGNPECGNHLGELKDNNGNPVSGRSLNHKNKKLMPRVAGYQEKRRLRGCSHSTLSTEGDVSQATLKATRRSKGFSENLESNKKNEQSSIKQGGSSMKRARRRIIFDTHVTPLTQKSREKMNILSPESLSLKRSRSGRLLLPTLDFWRNQIPVYDMDRNITGVQEESRPSAGIKSEPQKKQKRRK